jgi:hypothetical protein
MEDVMDGLGGRKTEFVCDVRNLGDYLERSVSPWGKLGCDVTW